MTAVPPVAHLLASMVELEVSVVVESDVLPDVSLSVESFELFDLLAVPEPHPQKAARGITALMRAV